MLVYTPLLAIFILVAAALSIGILRAFRPNFAYAWIIAALGAMVAWPLVVVSILSTPATIPLASWETETLFPSSPSLVIDQISWSFALVISTLALSVILTDAARASEAESSSWASSLFLSAIGIFAVLAGNPLTLLFAWTAIDLMQLIIFIWRLKPGEELDKTLVGFSGRVMGTILLILAMIYAPAPVGEDGFQMLSLVASLFVLLAAGFRLGVIPLSGPLQQEFELRRGLGAISQLIPAAAGLVLVVRFASNLVMTNLVTPLLIISLLSGIYAAYMWIVSPDELKGRLYWVIGFGSLAYVSALMGGVEASLTWGIVGLLTGGLIFLMSAGQKYTLVFIILGMVTLSGVPFTPAANGMLLYASPATSLIYLFVLPHAFLLAGYLKQGIRDRDPLSGVERWVSVIYPWGLTLLLLVQVIIIWWGIRPIFSLAGTMVAAVTLGLAALIYWAYLHGYRIPHFFQNVLDPLFSLGWLRRLTGSAYTLVGRIIAGINSVLEGEGGVLWAILILILLVAYLSQVGIAE